MRKRIVLFAYYTAVFLVCLFVALNNPGTVRTTFYSAFFNIIWALLCLFMIIFHTPSVQSFSIEHAYQDLRHLRYRKDEGMTFVLPEDEYRHLRFGFRRRDREFYAEHTAPFAFCLFSAVTPVYLPIILFLPEMTGMLIGMLPVSAVVLVFMVRAMKDMAKLKALEQAERDRAMREHEEQERKKHWKY